VRIVAMDQTEREKRIYMAKLAEQAERYDGTYFSPTLERDLLSLSLFYGLQFRAVRASAAIA
jgi:hypothetical protein